MVVPLVVRSTAVTVAALVALGMGAAPMTAWAQSLRMRLVPPETQAAPVRFGMAGAFAGRS